MPLIIMVCLVLLAVGWFIDFLIGPPGDRRIKDSLINFYIAIEEGDWSALYRRPAATLHRFMCLVLAANPLSIRYVWRTFRLSTIATLALFAASMIWTYFRTALDETNCIVPPVSQFLQIPEYLGDFLVEILIVNFAFDLVSWSICQQASRYLSNAKGLTAPVLLLFFAPLTAFLILFLIYSIYLPLAIVSDLRAMGFSHGIATAKQLFWGNLWSNFNLITLPHEPFHLDCSRGSHTLFSISKFSLMQILGAETLMPIVLLFVACAFGAFVFLTRGLTQRPMSFLLQRIDSSQRTATSLVLLFLGGLVSLLIAYHRLMYSHQ